MKIAVFPSIGIGDCLIMLTASNALQDNGWDVTTYHNSIQSLNPWLSKHQMKRFESFDELEAFDHIIVQNDNTPFCFELIAFIKLLPHVTLSVLYPGYDLGKNGPLSPHDIVFNSSIPMVQNIQNAMKKLFDIPSCDADNGLIPPEKLIHKKNKRQILIHPTASIMERTWLAKKFIKVAKALKKQGFDVKITVKNDERDAWIEKTQDSNMVPNLTSLADLAKLTYESAALIGNESGNAHLASCLKIPTLMITGNAKRTKLWRVGWTPGQLIAPPSYIPNIKGLRLRDNKWQYFITVSQTLKAFESIISE